MTRTLALLCAVLLPQIAMAEPFAEANGVWMRDDGNARVRIAPCGPQLCATNLWIKDTSKGEEPGDRLVMTLTQSDSRTLKGEAFDPKRNSSYAMTLKITDLGLTTRGCVIGGLLCRDVTWTPARE